MKHCCFHTAVIAAMVTFLNAEQHFVLPGRSLHAAVQNARAGDTIVVDNGMYDGNITLSKTLSLFGTEKAVLRGAGKGSVVTVTADSCVIRNVIIENTGRDLLYEDAGILLLSDHNTVQLSVIRNTLFGIYLKQSHGNTIANNTITSFPDLDQGQRGSGIHVWNSHRNILIGNNISHTRDGIYIQNANHTYIADNNVHSLRYGLHYMYADSNTFLRNSFYDNVAGAAIMYTRNIVMKHNLFIRNRGFASYGILLQDCHRSVADSNIIADNVTGLFLESSTQNIFTGNIIAKNDYALQMYQNSSGNTFTGNAFMDNLNLLTLVGKRTDSKFNGDQTGNYWSSYDGYDMDGDGIGDVPVKIRSVFNFLEGNNANVRLFLYSPASQALSASAAAFPVIDINNETDAFPLMRPPNVEWSVPMMMTVAGGRTGSKESAAAVISGGTALCVLAAILLLRRREWKRTE